MNVYLPPSITQNDVDMTIGLISDTHMPERWPQLPTAVSQIFADVHMILHAGDVGELWVLDELSQIAPVVAVHGNDDTVDSQRELPYQQIVTINRQRLLLWHSHYPNQVDEMHSRRSDSLHEGCLRSIARARSAGASLVVFGHWHIPLIFEQDGIVVVNPGAIAAGNVTHQLRHQTVALLYMLKNGRFHITHVDVNQPERPFELKTDIDAGFEANLARYGRSILSPDLRPIGSILRPLYLLNPSAFMDVFLPIAHEVWAGKREFITLDDVPIAIETADIRQKDRQRFLEKWAELIA